MFRFYFFPPRELGRQKTTIELDTLSVKPAQLQALEKVINEKIRAHIPVNVQLLSIDDPAVDKVHILILYEYFMVLKHSSSCSTARTKVKILHIANNCICRDITFVVCVPDAD